MANGIRKYIFSITLLLTLFGPDVSKLHAQGNDPVLAGMIALYTDKAKKELKQQEQMMLLEATGHIWITEEVNATTDLQKEFNKYLDDFHNIISYAAQIYGFYHEIDRMVDNLGSFNDQLSAHPSNALAVALSSNRNKIYREIIMGSVDIVNDIRQVCLSDTKMTEKERLEVVFGIRPKLKLMNKKLQRLTKAVKYTSLADVWAEIDYNARSEADKASITKQCMERWKRNGRPK
jgi:hypothetical protein